MQEGQFRIQRTTTLGGSAANTITLRNGTQFELYEVTSEQVWSFALNSGSAISIIDATANKLNNWLTGPITLNGEVFLTGNSSVYGTLAYSGTNILGALTLNAGTVSVLGTNAYGSSAIVAGASGKNVTVAAPLQAPAGQGVYGIELEEQGSGCLGEPYVSIEGDGVGATAVANMTDDGTSNGTYKVASVTITCPGVNYATAPTVLFKGGGATNTLTAALAGAITRTDNASGGLTKTGAGVLTLSGANTYTGTTTVACGTLKLGVANALQPNTQVTLAGGTLDLSGFTVTNALSGTGLITNGTLQAVLSAAGENAVGADTITLASATLKGLYLADVTAAGESDSIAVQGNIDLSNVTLQIVDPDLLDTHRRYTLLTCTGTRTGTFSSTDLPNSRWHVLYQPDGTVKLFYVGGTLLRVF